MDALPFRYALRHPRASREAKAQPREQSIEGASSPREQGSEDLLTSSVELLIVIPARAGKRSSTATSKPASDSHPRASREAKRHRQAALQCRASSPREQGSEVRGQNGHYVRFGHAHAQAGEKC